jgi:hypothetical protein
MMKITDGRTAVTNHSVNDENNRMDDRSDDTSGASQRMIASVKIRQALQVAVQDVPQVKTFQSKRHSGYQSKRHSSITSENLSECWQIGLLQEKETSPRLVRSAMMPLARR